MSGKTIGIVDLHTHLLPHMDDGSKDTAMSLEMLRRQAEQGVNVVCATSHFYAHEEPPEAFCKRRAAALAHLRSAMPPDAPRILAASETAFFAGIGREKALEMLCIENTWTLMLEMSFSVWTDFQLEEVRVLQLNRDSMVEMPVLGVNGGVIGTDTAQLALAHSYGNGREESCENNVTTVSRLLEDQPIDGYFAVNMDAVNILTDLVGGITVTLNSDLTARNPAWTEGAVVTLTGENALGFVRSRKGVERMEPIFPAWCGSGSI